MCQIFRPLFVNFVLGLCVLELYKKLLALISSSPNLLSKLLLQETEPTLDFTLGWGLHPNKMTFTEYELSGAMSGFVLRNSGIQ